MLVRPRGRSITCHPVLAQREPSRPAQPARCVGARFDRSPADARALAALQDTAGTRCGPSSVSPETNTRIICTGARSVRRADRLRRRRCCGPFSAPERFGLIAAPAIVSACVGAIATLTLLLYCRPRHRFSLLHRLCCGPCVLCQETRTLSFHSVEDGCERRHCSTWLPRCARCGLV